ncbi:MAG: saccharopine dehydrogenase NADP-binding domain-containing protein, partial [Myxococcota bacterium]|nr:saccharopine dehydrogenase NADP-binding domain-containing protein [Myxococcota bacterium]
MLLYGASGYTGRLVADGLCRRGLAPILAGRSPARLVPLARRRGLEVRAFDLEDPRRIAASLDGVAVVLHAAGPFADTAPPMLEACLRRGVHYADLSAEIGSIEAVRARDGEARARGVTLLPAAGHAVVTSDCLAAHVASRLPGAVRLRIAVGGLGPLSRGSLGALVAHAGEPPRVRRDGRLMDADSGPPRRFDFGAGPRPAVRVGWADLATAPHSTGIGDVETWFDAIPSLRIGLGASRLFGDVLRQPPVRAWLAAWNDFL